MLQVMVVFTEKLGVEIQGVESWGWSGSDF